MNLYRLSALLFCISLCTLSTYAHEGHEIAETTKTISPDAEDYPWEKLSVSLGVFTSKTDTSLRFGAGVGLDINLEDLTGVEATNNVFRTDAYWRFSDNRKHRVDLSWFAFHRKATRNLSKDIIIEDKDDNEIIIPLGTTVKSTFNIDIMQLAYSYSFLQNDSADLAVGIGLFVMPISLSLEAKGFVDSSSDQGFTAPLPVFNVRGDFLITTNWYFRTKAQILYLEIERFTGSIVEFQSAVEYTPFDHVGFGLGFDSFNFVLEGDGTEDYPGIDLKGKLSFRYAGIQLYTKVFF